MIIYPTLTPAYGRDYRSRTEVFAAYKEGKDFIFHDISSRWDGKMCSIRDFPHQPVRLRYNNLRQITIFTPQENN